MPKYIHQKHFVPVPEPTPPQYHSVPVPVKVTDPGKIIKVPSPMPQQTIVKNKAGGAKGCVEGPRELHDIPAIPARCLSSVSTLVFYILFDAHGLRFSNGPRSSTCVFTKEYSF